MKLSELSAGIASGYFTKAVQFLATVGIVPFLLRDDVLGLDRYGAAFTLLGIVSVLSLLTSGLRMSFDRSIAHEIGSDGESVGEFVGCGTKILLGSGLLFAVIVLCLGSILLDVVGLNGTPDEQAALNWASLLVVAENGLYLARAPLLTRGDVLFVNFAGMAEVVLRTASMVFCFVNYDATLASYFSIQAFWTVARQLALFVRVVRKFPRDVRGSIRAPLTRASSSLSYSTPVLATEGASFMVRRAPVLVASYFLGAKEAGLVAIVVNTIQNYILQILFAVAQPLAIPLAARIDLSKLSSHRRRLIWDVEALYCACVILFTAQIALWLPEIVLLWLGPEYSSIVLPAQVTIWACCVEICLSIRRSVLIAQGHMRAIVPIVSLSASISLVGILLSGWLLESWQWIVFATSTHFLVANVLGIHREFSRSFVRPEESSGIVKIVASGPAFCIAIIGSRLMTDSMIPDHLIAIAVATLSILLSVFTLVMSPSRAVALAMLLVRRRSQSIFSDEPDSSRK